MHQLRPTNPNLDIVKISTCMQNVVKSHPFILKKFRGNKIITGAKGHNSVINMRNLTQNSPKQ